ncbi:MAG: hypothetical protein ACKV2T_34225 [Kofleriaceae bacterium]
MPTWDETRDYLRSKYQLMHDDAAWVGVGIAFQADGKTLQQRVRIEPRKIGPIPGILIGCEVVEATKVPPAKALERNFAFPIGGLATFKGSLILMAVLPLEGLQWNTLTLILENLAKDAAVLRETAPGGAGN